MSLAGHIARALGTAVVFVAAAVLGLSLHVDSPAMRRAAATRVDALLGPLFAGKIVIERIGAVHLKSVTGVDARVEDAEGVTVLRVHGLAGRIALFRMVRSLWRGSDIVVNVAEASVEDADVNLDPDASGQLRIVRAFQPRSPGAPGAPGPQVHFALPVAHVGHASVHGRPPGAPPIDGDVYDAAGQVTATPPAVTVDVAHARVVARSLPVAKDASGDVEFHLSLGAAAQQELALRGSFQGSLGAIAGRAEAKYEKGALEAVVDVPSAAPDAARALVPAWPLTAPAAVHAEARGVLPVVDVRAHAALEGGKLDVTGPVTLAPLQAKLHFDAKAIDAHAISALAPVSDLSAGGDVSVAEEPSGALSARFTIAVARGRLASAPTPRTELTGEITRGPSPSGDITATGKVTVREPGLPAEVSGRLTGRAGAFVLSFDATASADRLDAVPLLRGAARGRASARAVGTLDFKSESVDANVTTDAEDLQAGIFGASALRAEGRVTGPLADPFVDVDLAAEGLSAGAVRVAAARAQARLEITGGNLRNVDLSVYEGGEQARLRAALIGLSGGELTVDGAGIEGLGKPIEATIHASSSRLFARVSAPEIDLVRVAHFAHLTRVRQGTVGVDVEATVGGGATEGRITLDLTNGLFGEFGDTTAHVNAILHGREVAGLATVRVGDIGSLQVVSSSLEIGGKGALNAQSWRHAWGKIDVTGHVDLPKFVTKLPKEALPFDEIRGVLDVTARLERDSATDVTPAIDVSARTTGLTMFGNGVAGWRFEGVDAGVRVRVDGDTGATAVGAQVFDKLGGIASLTASSNDVPYAIFLSGDAPRAALRAMPFEASLALAPRRVETLPPSFGVTFGTGTLEGTLTWKGAAAEPTIDVVGKLTHGGVDPRLFALPLDLAWTAGYARDHARSSMTATVRDRQVMVANVSGDVRASDVLAGLGGAEVPWNASGRVHIEGLPLQSLSAFDQRLVHGRVTGDFTVDQLHEDGRADLALTFDGLKVGDIACKDASLRASAGGHAMDASFQVREEDGSMAAKAHAGAHWGRALFPSLDVSQPANVSVWAKNFRAALLLPLASQFLSDLDGQIDGDASVVIDPAANVARPQGQLSLKNGAFELNSLGGEFSEVSAKLALTPDGILRLEDVHARSLNGALVAAATARLDGLAFGGARATLQVPRKTPLPIVFDGVQLGTMDGDVNATISEASGGKQLDVDLDVPTLHVLLPSAPAHDVQQLGELEGVRTGLAGGPMGFVSVPLDPVSDDAALRAPRKPIQITVKLGNDVEVKRAAGGAGQPDLDVALSGEPIATIADQVSATGQVRLVRGTIGIQGKKFDIENGTVTFVGDDPTNPQVVVSAGWTAPDGTRVTANFVGPLKTGKVTLRADPAPPGGENGILALILFGASDQDANGGGAGMGAGFAGGAAAAPINQFLGGALDKFGLGGGITTKIDTSQTNPRPEVELQIARDISLEVAWVLGLPPPGQPDTTLVTFNWRFLRKWSLLTTVGDQGTSILDVVWQHRY